MYIVARTHPRKRRLSRPIILRPSQQYVLTRPTVVEDQFSPMGFFGEPRKPLADQIRQSWATDKDPQKIFAILRGQPKFPLDPAVLVAVEEILRLRADELWLATTLATNGPEPLWPLADIRQRVQKVKAMGPEPGNYQATLADPNPGTSLSGGCIDSLKSTQLPLAFFFPGTSDSRALIISGVHGDETRAVEVVQKLQTLLQTRSAAGNKPFFTTIVVPVVIPRTFKGSRNVPGGKGLTAKDVLVCRPVEPNRNFPLPGEDLAQAQARGSSNRDAPELMIQTSAGVLRAPKDSGGGPSVSSIRMLPETRILLSLIERFQPDRLATIHDHSLKQDCHACTTGQKSKCGGEGPGLFMDPRGIDPKTNTIKNAPEFNKDEQLAERMLKGAFAKLPCGRNALKGAFPPFAGNQAVFNPTVRYFSLQRVEGNSLGDWAPIPTRARPGIATLTVEVPKYEKSHRAAETLIKDLHRDLLREIFLEP